MGASEASPSLELVSQFPILSVDPIRKRMVLFSILMDTWALSTLVDVASYIHCLMTEKDHVKMKKVSISSLFNEAQQVYWVSFPFLVPFVHLSSLHHVLMILSFCFSGFGSPS